LLSMHDRVFCFVFWKGSSLLQRSVCALQKKKNGMRSRPLTAEGTTATQQLPSCCQGRSQRERQPFFLGAVWRVYAAREPQSTTPEGRGWGLITAVVGADHGVLAAQVVEGAARKRTRCGSFVFFGGGGVN
jgi:hypothetical protein